MKQNHGFSVELATELDSVELAILVRHFQFWIHRNYESGTNLHEGRTWWCQTNKQIASKFPYWSEDKLFRMICELVIKNILIKGNFSNKRFDRTVWYSFQEEDKFILNNKVHKEMI